MEKAKYLKAKKEGFGYRRRKDLVVKPNNNSADYITPNFATGCFCSCSYCVEEGTLITTSKGEIPVEQIKKGDLILAYDIVKEQFVETQIGLTTYREVEELIEIKVEDSFIRVSLDHPFFTQRGWVKAKNLSNLDKLLCYY